MSNPNVFIIVYKGKEIIFDFPKVNFKHELVQSISYLLQHFVRIKGIIQYNLLEELCFSEKIVFEDSLPLVFYENSAYAFIDFRELFTFYQKKSHKINSITFYTEQIEPRNCNSQYLSEIAKQYGLHDYPLEIQCDSNEEVIKRLREENNKLKKYLFAVKENKADISFFDFDDYEEGEMIGNGATSSIKLYKKKDVQKYAKKELRDFNKITLQHFITEGKILFKLHHPCIVDIIAVNYGDDKNPPSMILSLESESLEDAIEKNELDHNQKNMILVEIVLGMRYIHHRNFMHRDLKPGNILLTKEKHVKISDFGLAKEINISVSLTKGVGTLRFMAPELYDCNIEYTNKVDVYAFGIILFYLVTNGYPPYIMKNIMNGVIPTIPPRVASWVSQLIVQCLSFDPENRPTFVEIFELMKSNNFDFFSDKNGQPLDEIQLKSKQDIETRVLEIEAFEYQHQND